jgi:glycosyltransferase involved in cell wall biosynthesis
MYEYDRSKEINISPFITLKYFNTFDDALDELAGNYEHVITIYISPKDRLKYAFFRKKHSLSTKFHCIYFNWPDSLIKRRLYFSEARLSPYNGMLFCISERQYEYVRKWAKNAIHILPPVPKEYFLKPKEKPINKKLRITFLGRVDPGKGINDVVDIFNALKDNDNFECAIYGIHIPQHKKSLEIHNCLKNQRKIKYIEVDRQNYSPGIEDFVGNILKETDIFIQPYKRLSSTIDTPLLLLEAIASLCVVITKPFGNIPQIYGKSKFLVQERNFITCVINFLKSISVDEILLERERLYEQNKRLNFNTDEIARKFINALLS